MPRSATPPGAARAPVSLRSKGPEAADQKEPSTVAQQFLQAAADGLTSGAVTALRKTLPAGLRPAASRSPRSKSQKEETVRRHSAHASAGRNPPASTGGGADGSASAFLFNDRRGSRHSISAATEAAVQAIATEILEAEDTSAPALHQPARAQSSQALAPRSPPPDPWASSDSEAESDESNKRDADSSASASASLQARALQDQAQTEASASASRSTAWSGGSSLPSAEPEGEPVERRRSRGRERGGPRQSSPSPTAAAARLHRALSHVQTCASKGNFSEAILACLPALDGPQEVVDIIGSLLAAWQASIKKQKRENQDAMEALVSEVTSAREKDSPEVWRLLEEIEERETEVSEEVHKRTELQQHIRALDQELRAAQNDIRAAQDRADQWRRLKDDKERELFAQIRKREDAEREVSFLRQSAWLADRTARENASLKKRLQQAEANAASMEPSALARQIAESECGPLRRCARESRAAVKKKLMVKWHPDKQPSPEHVDLATQVMQALQNQPEWKL